MSTHPFVESRVPLVFAHRGASANAPSNTLVSFGEALEQGADILETDMHWTKDGHVVLCHNDTVDETSDGTGAIADKTLKELKNLDFGYRFSVDGGQSYPFRGVGIRIPTLEEALTMFPTAKFNIDIKPKKGWHLAALIRQLYDLGAEHRVLLASFHHGPLQQIRAMNPGIATSASIQDTFQFCLSVWTGINQNKPVPYCALQVPVSGYGIPVVTPKFIQRAHAMGIKVHVWTVDDENEMRRLLEMGVDGLVSNRPGTAVAMRNEWKRDAKTG